MIGEGPEGKDGIKSLYIESVAVVTVIKWPDLPQSLDRLEICNPEPLRYCTNLKYEEIFGRWPPYGCFLHCPHCIFLNFSPTCERAFLGASSLPITR